MSTSSQFTDIKIDFNFPIVIQPGVYNGLILIKNNDTNEIVDQVNLSFNIRIPKGRIYFDCYHNSDYGDTALENYYNFTKLLLNNQIDLDFKSSLINYPSLSQYDLLILPDIENPLTDNEIFAIKKFWDNGGNILILGNYYPSTAIESLNNLLINLNVGINYAKILQIYVYQKYYNSPNYKRYLKFYLVNWSRLGSEQLQGLYLSAIRYKTCYSSL